MAQAQPGRADSPLPATDNLGHIAASAQAIANAVDTILRTRGAKMGLADLALLRQLASQAEARPIGWIARRLGVTRQRVQKQLEQLVQAQLVEIQVSSDDKRSRSVSVTTQGRAALAAASDTLSGALAASELLEKAKNLDPLRRRLGGLAHLLSRIEHAGRPQRRAPKQT